ncbi:MAG: LD-carboxypeptidase [Bdellovibrionales bacterium]|nr:LD-carboxypeptidase [Bdellovibrionales bacterium]
MKKVAKRTGKRTGTSRPKQAKRAPRASKSGRKSTSAPAPSRPPRAIVGVVAPSSPAPLVELEIGASRLAAEGFEVFFHPQVKQVDAFFAGTDSERALALLDYAFDPDLTVIWAARGGYGAVRLLPILDEILAKVGTPERKTLVGFSDATVLLEYVRTRWGWRAIHGPMPATVHIERVRGKEWRAFTELLAGETDGFAFRTRPIHRPEGFTRVQGEVVGGNLAMIHSVLGTPYAFDLKGKILFLEEIGEAPYRMDRMMQQLHLAGALDGVKAIVLGTFTDCRDSSPQVYAAAPKGRGKPKMKPLRRTLSEREVLATVFGEMGAALGIPVYAGLPVGHGEGPGALELGVVAELEADGSFGTRR